MKVISYIENNFIKLFWFLSAIIFVLIAFRSFFIPFSHDEAATFFFYVQSDDYLPYKAHIYTNNHVLNSALTNLCYHIAGSHRFILRLPNIFSFLILCFGIFKFCKHLKTLQAKIILISFFLLTLNFLDFFELCRGYGLSFSFAILGLSYLTDYFQSKKTQDFILLSLCMQLALAANLILVILLIILLLFTLLFQIKNKLFFKPGIIISQIINILILIFWIKFSFFYKEHGSLDSGVGENYWEVSFKSLMLFLFGTDALWMQILVLITFAGVLILSIRSFFQPPVSFNKIFTPQIFYSLVLTMLIIAFYMQKKILDVNFPEDRTGVFFYLLLVLGLTFLVDSIPQKISGAIAISFLIPSVLFFICHYNIHDFSSPFYHTIPKSIYDDLVGESKKSKEVITIGGHRIREMDYAFLNYRGNSVLNNIDNSEQMIMNCDYYFAMKREQPYYKYFYDEIAYDIKWDRALLKRKEKIQRTELYKMPDVPKIYKGNGEYFEFFRLKDSVLKTRNCVEADIEMQFDSIPKPLPASIVLQVNDTKGEMIYYKRIQLNWLADNLNGQTKHLKLTTGALPNNTADLVLYIWNIKQSELNFTINQIKILELKGHGVNVMIPESYYKYLDKTNNNKPLL